MLTTVRAVAGQPIARFDDLCEVPILGISSVMVVGTGVSVPCAQLGTQFCKSLVPSPTAWVPVQEDHAMSVTTFPPSPLKSISEGSVPANVLRQTYYPDR